MDEIVDVFFCQIVQIGISWSEPIIFTKYPHGEYTNDDINNTRIEEKSDINICHLREYQKDDRNDLAYLVGNMDDGV